MIRSPAPYPDSVLRSCLPWILAAAFLLSGCAPSEPETEYLARKALLVRQNQGIRELIQEEEAGSLVPRDRFLVGIDQSIVESLFQSQLPLERPLGNHFLVRLDSATVRLEDKFGIITIAGAVRRVETPERVTALRIHGGLGAVSIDPRTNLLNVDIAIDRIDVLDAGILEGVLGRGGKAFLGARGRPLLQDALPHLEIPVLLGRTIRVPAVATEGFQLDSLVVPLNLSVERVTAVGGKLWATIDADLGELQGAERGVGVVVRKKHRKGRTS